MRPTPSPFTYPAKTPQFQAGDEGRFLRALLDSVEDGEEVLPPQPETSPLEAAYDLALMNDRARLALALQALPVFPASGLLAPLHVPEGAHLVRIAAVLLECMVSGDLTDIAACQEWAGHTQTVVHDLAKAAWGDAERMSMFTLLHDTITRDWPTGGLPGDRSPPDWVVTAVLSGRCLSNMIVAASSLRAFRSGVDPSIRGDVPAESRRWAERIVMDVFRRHRAGEAFPVMSLTEADLLYLSRHPLPDMRRLAVTLAHMVKPEHGHVGAPAGRKRSSM